MKKLPILIVDDQHLFAEGLKYVLLGEGGKEIEVVGIAENGEQAIQMARILRPEIILMDIRMPVMDGVKATETIHKEYPEIKILILTTFDDDELAYRALSCGASGYVLKSIDPPDLILSIKAVHSGGYYLAPSVGFKLIDIMRPDRKDEPPGDGGITAVILSKVSSLTLREAEVLVMVIKAKRNGAIAEELCISEKTVKNHISSIYEKLGIHNRLKLISHVTKLITE